jgi:hypothetical protein
MIPPFRETRDYVQRVKGRTAAVEARSPRLAIYKTIEIVNGREVPRYSNVKPAAGAYEIVTRLPRPPASAAAPSAQ